MQSSGRLYSQISAEAGVTPEVAMIGAYLADLSRSGRTLAEAVTLLRRPRADVRNHARDFGVKFVDYPGEPPLALQWVKVKRGEWELRDGAKVVAAMSSDGEGGYTAGIFVAGRPLTFDGSKPDVAARRLSKEIDQRAAEIFGNDDVVIDFAPTGDRFAPSRIGDPVKMTRALAA